AGELTVASVDSANDDAVPQSRVGTGVEAAADTAEAQHVAAAELDRASVVERQLVERGLRAENRLTPQDIVEPRADTHGADGGDERRTWCGQLEPPEVRSEWPRA